MEALIGHKIGMTRIYNEKGQSVPVTVVHVPHNIVHQVKTVETDGYNALQIGIGEQKPQRINKPLKNHLVKAKRGLSKELREIRLANELDSEIELKVGDEIDFDSVFKEGSFVDVFGRSTGKGFAGVMKRHGMRGQPATHGTHEAFRHGGSIGACATPGRVFKNTKMEGRMGNANVAQQGLEIVSIRSEDRALLIKGSVPGVKGSTVLVKKSIKKS